jgi:SIR2-like domain
MSFSRPNESASAQEDFSEHWETVVLNLLRGRVTPVLGAGASLYGRAAVDGSHPPANGESRGPSDVGDPSLAKWEGTPSAGELAAYLAREFRVKEASNDLLQVAQWVYALRGGSGGLYDALHDVFDKDFPPTTLHDFLAQLPGRLRNAGRGKPPLVVTTNYDDLMEKALEARGEKYDLVVYMAEGQHEGLFCHVASDGTLEPIESPESYLAVDPDRQTVVLKMHGFVCRRDPCDDSYVITEDHYIEYLTRTDMTKLLPKPVMARLLNCHLLFLGYSLRDWNFRAILYQIHHHRLHDNDWWAVRLNPDRLECRSWEKRNVEIIDTALEQYIPALEAAFNTELGRRWEGRT